MYHLTRSSYSFRADAILVRYLHACGAKAKSAFGQAGSGTVASRPARPQNARENRETDIQCHKSQKRTGDITEHHLHDREHRKRRAEFRIEVKQQMVKARIHDAIADAEQENVECVNLGER